MPLQARYTPQLNHYLNEKTTKRNTIISRI